MPVDTEVAWAAGFFDGEGSVYIRHTARHKGGTMPHKTYPLLTVELSISQVRHEPLDRFYALVRCGKYGGPYKPRHENANPYYRWNTAGRPIVHKVACLLWPYLSLPKQEQFHDCWAQLKKNATKKSPFLPMLPAISAGDSI